MRNGVVSHEIVSPSHLHLYPDPSRTILRPFMVDDPPAFAVEGRPRARRIAARVDSLDREALGRALERALASLAQRHRDVEALLLRRFDEARGLLADGYAPDRARKLLIGAYFSEEYSFESAALFNPSMVLHPDQENVPPGGVRFLLSLRGIGEGHVSSVTFRTGVWTADGGFHVDPPSRIAVPPRIERIADGDGTTRLHCAGSHDISETVFFPMTPSQRQGIEDVRLVRFTGEDGAVRYLGTYTAYDGRDARSELLDCLDFRSFAMQTLSGEAAASKGMALFPRPIDGRFAMLGRQDNENIWLLTSQDLRHWEGGCRIVTPRWPWEFVQMGNCGSPIEIEEGWLVLAHGVGMARNYCMGACLLDRKDPSRLLARTAEPILRPDPKERDGYVPNVVYSCGGMVHERTLLLPYGVADTFAAFASVPVDRLLAAMT